MMVKKETPESSINQEIIRKVHLILADLKSGSEILSFLQDTEPIFMSEVSRFIQTEVNRLKYNLPEQQTLYVGSVIGAAYIAGFLIAREAAHRTYNGLMKFDSPVEKAIDPEDIDRLLDKFHNEGQAPKEIGKSIKKYLRKGGYKLPSKSSKKKGRRLKIEGLEG